MVSLTRNEFDVLVVTLAWLAGFAPLFFWHAQAALGRAPARAAPTWVQCVGLALVASPFARMLVGIFLTYDNLFTYTVLEPAPREAIWRAVWRDVVYDLALPLLGLLMWCNAVPGFPSRRAPRRGILASLRDHGLGARAGYGRDALHGLALFAFIALAYVVAFVLSKTVFAQLSANGDESRYWIHMTLLLIVLRSGMAGLSEEFLFRGLLMTRLSRHMPFVAAALLQAAFFALVHAGYGTWTHVAGPFVFGLGMAWVSRVLGVTVAMLLHAEINIVFFAFEVSGYVPGAWWLLAALVLVNIAAAALTRMEGARVLARSLVAPLRAPAPAGDLDEPRAG